MKYTIHMGQSVNCFHSYRVFDRESDALAYFWAMANCNHPQRCFWLQGFDGWETNDHLKGKTFPERLTDKINQFIDEDNALPME